MRLKDKMLRLTTKTRHLIEKQLKKEGIIPKKNWYKKMLCLISETEEGDTFFTIFNQVTREFYTSCTIFNEVDSYDLFIGEIISINRMGKNLNFQNAVIDDNTICFSMFR